MNASIVVYRVEKVAPTWVALASWTFSRNDDKARGKCPTCDHLIVYEFEATAVAQSVGPNEPDGAPRKITCGCLETHADAAGESHRGCGRYWFVRILPDAAGQHVIPEFDESMQSIADQLAEVTPATQEATVRAAAEKWVAGVTALLGLFGISGISFGKDIFAGLGTGTKWVLGIALVAAVGSAALAVLRTYRAAYGWPHEANTANVNAVRKWARNRRAAPGKAADNLRAGVHLALTSLVFACIGAVAVWFGGSAPTVSVKVTRTDDTFVCGELLSSTAAGELRIRRADGTVDTVKATELGKVSPVVKCGG